MYVLMTERSQLAAYSLMLNIIGMAIIEYVARGEQSIKNGLT